MTKCPKCDKTLVRINLEAITADAGMTRYKSVIFSCPFCHAALGAQIDPLAVSSDLKAALKKTQRGT